MARALARRLLADLRLPPGAARLPWRLRPRVLGSGLSAPLTDVIDMRALYRLSQPILAADAFLMKHIGGGLLVGDRGHTSRAGTPIAAQADFSPRSLPARIYLEELTIGLVPRVGGDSVLRADAFVSWYPSRTAAEHIYAGKYRAIIVTAPARGFRGTVTRTFTRRSAVTSMASIVNSLPAMPHVVRNCTAMSTATSYSLVFKPRASRWPRVVAATQGCAVYAVTVGGRSQPPLDEAGLLKLTTAIRKLLGFAPLP
jgi:hypothetical protein